MKRMPLLATVLALIILSASIAYWLMALNPPPQRPLANVAVVMAPPPSVDAAATLFGGQVATAVVSNYVLTGVIASGSQGVAIIVADGGVPMALKIGRELAPGITLSEVYPRYVMLSDNGMTKRIDLAADSKAAAPMSEVLTAPVSNQPVVNGAQNVPEPPMAPGALQQPPMAPGALQQPPNMMTGQQAPMPQQGGQNPQQGPSQANPGAVVAPSIPPPNQIETPPPTRNFATPATQ